MSTLCNHFHNCSHVPNIHISCLFNQTVLSDVQVNLLEDSGSITRIANASNPEPNGIILQNIQILQVKKLQDWGVSKGFFEISTYESSIPRLLTSVCVLAPLFAVV